MGIRNIFGRPRFAAACVLGAGMLAAYMVAGGRGDPTDARGTRAPAPQVAHAYGTDRDTLLGVLPRTRLPSETGEVPHERGAAAERHAVRINRGAAERAAMTRGDLPVTLPGEGHFKLRFERSERLTPATWTFVGKLQTALGAQSAVITFGPAGAFGVLPTPSGRVFSLTTTRGVTVLEPARPLHPLRTDGRAVVDTVDAGPGVAATAAGAGQAGDVAVRAAASDVASTTAEPVRLDVLVLYTRNMAELRGSAVAAETEAVNAVATANQAHVDSGTGVRLEIAATRQVDYPATASNRLAYNDLSGNRMPDATDVAALRNAHQADLVALFRPYVEGDDNGGLGGVSGGSLRGAEGARDTAGFSVNNLSPYTFAHESGHNLGSAHDIATATVDGVVGYGAYPYSFGYRQDGPPAFATIMAYTKPGQSRVGYFSHPGTTACLGVACGQGGASDNVRSMRMMAQAVSDYRVAPGSIYITPALQTITEGDPGSLSRSMTFQVTLSTPAPPGGVRFDVAAVPRTASPNEFIANPMTGMVIPEGQRTFTYRVNMNVDLVPEPEESFDIVLSNVSGAMVHRATARGVIRDDDPRAMISGRFVVPPGMAPPSGSLFVYVEEYFPGTTSRTDSTYYNVAGPDYRFQVPVTAGMRVMLRVSNPGAPYTSFIEDLGRVDAARDVAVPLRRSVSVNGRLVFAAGHPVPTTPIDVIVIGGEGFSGFGYPVTAQPPYFNFTRTVPEGADVRLEVFSPPAPFVAQALPLGEVRTTQDVLMELRTERSLVLTTERLPEGAPGTSREHIVTGRLSTPAPAGGVTVEIATADGSARAGSDYVAASTVATVPAGSSSFRFAVTVQGDGVAEPDEYFDVVLRNPVGAWLPRQSHRVHLSNDDAGQPASDADGDGRGDLYWRGAETGRLVGWLMDGATRRAERSQDLPTREIVSGTGDFDSDGRRDFVTRDLARSVMTMWTANAEGTLVARPFGPHPSGDKALVGAGDADGDRRTELFWHSPGAQQFETWWMQGSDRIGVATAPIGAQYRVAGIGDFNADGRSDVLWTDRALTEVWLWVGNGNGAFEPRRVAAHPPAPWRIVHVGDVDGDARADILWHNDEAGQLDWWLMDGAGRRGVGSQSIPARYRVAGFEDLDGDGRRDIVWTDRARTEVWAWLARGAAFTPQWIAAHPGPGWETVLAAPDYVDAAPRTPVRGDLDGDGRSDIAWHSPAQEQFDAWYMAGALRRGHSSHGIPSQYRIGARGDFNGDGLHDVLWHDTGRTSLWMWLRDRAGGFSVQAVGAYPPSGWNLVGARDVDGDGRDDLVWHNAAIGQVDWWLMQGAGRRGVGSHPIPAKYHVAAIADLDGDGRADLVWRDDARTEVWAWLAAGSAFSPVYIGGHPADVEPVGSGDVDLDGREDLLWARTGGGRLDWWRMRGATWLSTGSRSVGTQYSVVDVADFDGDRRVEVLWRDTARTSLWLWHHGASSYSETSSLGAHPGGDWEPVGVRR